MNMHHTVHIENFQALNDAPYFEFKITSLSARHKDSTNTTTTTTTTTSVAAATTTSTITTTTTSTAARCTCTTTITASSTIKVVVWVIESIQRNDFVKQTSQKCLIHHE